MPVNLPDRHFFVYGEGRDLSAGIFTLFGVGDRVGFEVLVGGTAVLVGIKVCVLVGLKLTIGVGVRTIIDGTSFSLLRVAILIQTKIRAPSINKITDNKTRRFFIVSRKVLFIFEKRAFLPIITHMMDKKKQTNEKT